MIDSETDQYTEMRHDSSHCDRTVRHLGEGTRWLNCVALTLFSFASYRSEYLFETKVRGMEAGELGLVRWYINLILLKRRHLAKLVRVVNY